MNYYKTKQSDYYSGTRMDVISFLKNGTQEKVLEIGAGAGGGDSLCFIKENNMAKEVLGVELFELKIRKDRNGRELTNLLTLGLIDPYLSIQYIFEVKRIDV